MKQPILYMMLGFPGAGKTTTAHVIAEVSGSELIWEDRTRGEMFALPTFAADENDKLHNHLNTLTAELLQSGKSVVYDTSFNKLEDRQRMYDIANLAGARAILVWVKTDVEVAKHRATVNAALQPSRPLAKVLGDMDNSTFDRLCAKLETPGEDEFYVTMDGSKITSTYVREALGL